MMESIRDAAAPPRGDEQLQKIVQTYISSVTRKLGQRAGIPTPQPREPPATGQDRP